MTMKVKHKGLDAHKRMMRRMRREARPVTAVVCTKSSRGKLRRRPVWTSSTTTFTKRGGRTTTHKFRTSPRTVSRTARENARLVAVHRATGRDISVITQKAQRRATKRWKGAIRTFIKRPSINGLVRSAKEVADGLVDAIRERVEAGRLKPVTAATQKRKDREGIRPGLPPLIRTGALLRGLQGKGERKRRT